MSGSEQSRPPQGAEAASPAEASIDLSRYRVLVAGEFSASVKQWAGLTELGVKVSLVGMATEDVRKRLAVYPVAERCYCETQQELEAETYHHWSGADLVVLIGAPSDELERLLTPWMAEAAAASLEAHLSLVRVDDPSLSFLRTGEQWAFYLLGRSLGMGHARAREYMEECCGHAKQNS